LVTSPGDTVAPDGVVTLREALLAANTNTTVNEAVHDGSGGADRITFDTAGAFATPQTIRLAGTLGVADSVTIAGPGAANLTVLGTPTSRIFVVDDGVAGPGIAVEISGLTLAGGHTPDPGGAILNRESLTVSDASIIGNSALFGGGIANIEGQ